MAVATSVTGCNVPCQKWEFGCSSEIVLTSNCSSDGNCEIYVNTSILHGRGWNATGHMCNLLNSPPFHWQQPLLECKRAEVAELGQQGKNASWRQAYLRDSDDEEIAFLRD